MNKKGSKETSTMESVFLLIIDRLGNLSVNRRINGPLYSSMRRSFDEHPLAL